MTLDLRRSSEAITLDDSARLGPTWWRLRSTSCSQATANQAPSWRQSATMASRSACRRSLWPGACRGVQEMRPPDPTAFVSQLSEAQVAQAAAPDRFPGGDRQSGRAQIVAVQWVATAGVEGRALARRLQLLLAPKTAEVVAHEVEAPAGSSIQPRRRTA